MMGIGRASGDTRAQDAARMAINSPLLEMTIDGAKGVLFNITGGQNLGMFEIDEAAKVITKSIDPDAKVKFGAVIDEEMGDEVRITVIATGFDEGNRRPMPVQLPTREEPKKQANEQRPQQPPPEVRKPLFNPIPAQPFHLPPQQSVQPISRPTPEDPSAADDELDIPAFIRKKMK